MNDEKATLRKYEKRSCANNRRKALKEYRDAAAKEIEAFEEKYSQTIGFVLLRIWGA